MDKQEFQELAALLDHYEIELDRITPIGIQCDNQAQVFLLQYIVVGYGLFCLKLRTHDMTQEHIKTIVSVWLRMSQYGPNLIKQEPYTGIDNQHMV